jgi:hypothetical protein
VDVIPHGDGADLRGRSYGSLYSPVNARYHFASDQPFATLRGEFSGNYGSGQEASRATVEQRANGFQAVAAVPVWTSQLFVSDWWRQEAAPVGVIVTAGGVSVENRLEVKLTEVRVVLKDQIIELGEVAAGETKAFSLQGAKSTPLLSYVQTHAGNFASAVNSRQQAFGSDDRWQINDVPGAAMAASFVTMLNTPNNYNNFTVQSGFDLLPLVERGDAVLLAWVPRHSFTKPLNQFSARRGSKNTLVRIAATVKD